MSRIELIKCNNNQYRAVKCFSCFIIKKLFGILTHGGAGALIVIYSYNIIGLIHLRCSLFKNMFAL